MGFASSPRLTLFSALHSLLFFFPDFQRVPNLPSSLLFSVPPSGFCCPLFCLDGLVNQGFSSPAHCEESPQTNPFFPEKTARFPPISTIPLPTPQKFAAPKRHPCFTPFPASPLGILNDVLLESYGIQSAPGFFFFPSYPIPLVICLVFGGRFNGLLFLKIWYASHDLNGLREFSFILIFPH